MSQRSDEILFQYSNVIELVCLWIANISRFQVNADSTKTGGKKEWTLRYRNLESR